MSRKKLILSILLMISMIVAGIVLPALWKAEKQKNHTADPKQPAKEIQTEASTTSAVSQVISAKEQTMSSPTAIP